MGRVTITNIRKLETGGHCSVGDLRELIQNVPDGASIQIAQFHDQRDGTSTTLTVNMAGLPATSGVSLPQYPPGVRGGTWQGDVPVEPR